MKDYTDLLKNIGTIKKYAAGELIFFEGEIPTKFFVLMSGKVRVYKSGALGVEKTLHIFNPINFIAEMPSFQGIEYPASAVCEEDSQILTMNINEFKNQLKNSEFCFIFINSLLNKIRILEDFIINCTQPLQERLMNFIKENEELLPNLSQRQIAQKLNTTAESLSRTIKQLKSQGKINIQKGKIIIV